MLWELIWNIRSWWNIKSHIENERDYFIFFNCGD